MTIPIDQLRRRIYFIFGMWQPADGPGLGLREIGQAITTACPGAIVSFHSHDEPIAQRIIDEDDGAPIYLVGHSWGGDAAVQAAAAIDRAGFMMIEHLILLDPVPRAGWGFFNFSDFTIPHSVLRATCFRRSLVLLPPWSCPIRSAPFPKDNRPRFWSHDTFCSHPEVREFILSTVTAPRDL